MSGPGLKHDQEKPRMDLLDADFLEGVAQVLTFGARKYAAHNWRGGIHCSRLIASAYRHLGAINRGEDIDDESGLPHVYHLGCCVMFLASMLQTRKDLDDRFKQPQSPTLNKGDPNVLNRNPNSITSIWDYADSFRVQTPKVDESHSISTFGYQRGVDVS